MPGAVFTRLYCNKVKEMGLPHANLLSKDELCGQCVRLPYSYRKPILLSPLYLSLLHRKNSQQQVDSECLETHCKGFNYRHNCQTKMTSEMILVCLFQLLEVPKSQAGLSVSPVHRWSFELSRLQDNLNEKRIQRSFHVSVYLFMVCCSTTTTVVDIPKNVVPHKLSVENFYIPVKHQNSIDVVRQNVRLGSKCMIQFFPLFILYLKILRNPNLLGV